MKKIIACALVLVLVLSLAACGGDPSKSIIGTWKGTNYACTFNADGTGEVAVGKGVTSSCTWTYDEEAGVWNVNYGDGKDVATITSGENGQILNWQGSEYKRVG